jgi:hypothetical protein
MSFAKTDNTILSTTALLLIYLPKHLPKKHEKEGGETEKRFVLS